MDTTRQAVEAAIWRADLAPTQRLTLLYLATQDAHLAPVAVRTKDIAAMLYIHRATVWRHMRSLVDEGWVVVDDEGDGATARYLLTHPSNDVAKSNTQA